MSASLSCPSPFLSFFFLLHGPPSCSSFFPRLRTIILLSDQSRLSNGGRKSLGDADARFEITDESVESFP